jgi:tetratricopeptide (TPR) repeat protein
VATRERIVDAVLFGIESPPVLREAAASRAPGIGLFARGIERWRRGDKSAGGKDLRASIQGMNSSELNNACWALGEMNIAPDVALDACNDALKPMPKAASVLDSRGLIYLRLGRWSDAQADYDLALKLRPHSAPTLFARSIVLARLGQTGAAAADRAGALKLDATVAGYFHTLGLDR